MRLFNSINVHYYENILASIGRVKHWTVNVLNCHNKSLQLQTFLNFACLAMEIIHLKCAATHNRDSASLNKMMMTDRGDLELNKCPPGPSDYQDFLSQSLGKEPLGLTWAYLHSFLPGISE
jgi:hypothetical protein